MPSKTYLGVNLTIDWEGVGYREAEIDEPEGFAGLVPCRLSVNGVCIACSYISLTVARFWEAHQHPTAS